MSAHSVGEVFADDVTEHVMTVLHEDGLYRHVRFACPTTSLGHFDLVTWPGYLSYGGDRDGLVFARTRDMFEFFRAKSGWNMDRINPGYWAAKLTTRVPVKTYEADKFRQFINDAINSEVDEYPGLAKYASREIRDAERDGVFEFENGAREWLRDFEFVVPAVAPVRSFQFLDTWELDFTDWDFHYLYACHAIQWGIEQYDKARADSSGRLPSAMTT